MRVIGFMTIHYGVEYLKESLQSIVNHCDKVVVAYTPSPSHGFGSTLTCPDSPDTIYKICKEVLSEKLIWDVGYYSGEGQHRSVIYKYSNGYDLILSIDADEVFEEKDLPSALEYAYEGNARRYGIDGYLNFWRSFNHVCTDGFRPIRIENLNNNNSSQDLNCKLTIYHFSTAQSEPIMRYKYGVFGHASEIKPNWLEGTYFGWDGKTDDVHCVAYGIWNPVLFNKNTLPESLKQHVNFNKEVI